MQEKSFYTVEEAAQIIGIAEFTVRKWLRDGKLEGKRVGRFWRINKESVHSVLPEKGNPE